MSDDHQTLIARYDALSLLFTKDARLVHLTRDERFDLPAPPADEPTRRDIIGRYGGLGFTKWALDLSPDVTLNTALFEREWNALAERRRYLQPKLQELESVIHDLSWSNWVHSLPNLGMRNHVIFEHHPSGLIEDVTFANRHPPGAPLDVQWATERGANYNPFTNHMAEIELTKEKPLQFQMDPVESTRVCVTLCKDPRRSRMFSDWLWSRIYT